MNGFYDDPTSFPYIERAVLMEDIPLPVYNKKKKLKRKVFYSNKDSYKHEPYTSNYIDLYSPSEEDNEYVLAYNEIKNVTGKFYIPVLMASMTNKGQEVNTANRAPKTTGFKGNINSLPYNSSNCTQLIIPKYIVLQFVDLKNETPGSKDNFIPKGTEFLVTCVGGTMDLEQMRIIGLYTLTYDKGKFPKLTDKYYGGNPVS